MRREASRQWSINMAAMPLASPSLTAISPHEASRVSGVARYRRCVVSLFAFSLLPAMAPPRRRCRRGTKRWRANQRLSLDPFQLNLMKTARTPRPCVPIPPFPAADLCTHPLHHRLSFFPFFPLLGPVSKYPGTPASRCHGTDAQT